MERSDASGALLEIAPTRGWRALDLREVWLYREVLLVLAWRDLKVRYRQTILGVAWAFIQPALSTVVLTALFHRVARLDGPAGQPYPVFVLLGLVPWGLFAAGVQNSSQSLVGAAHLVSKVYFPRLIVPLAAILVAVVDALVAGLLVVPVMGYYRLAPGATIALLPLALLLAAALTAGAGLWLAALNAQYRDVKVVIPFVLQLGIFVTPVAYPVGALPPQLRLWATLNPMTGAVEAFRAATLGSTCDPWMLSWSIICAVALLASGAFYFRRTERTFADVL